MGFRRHRTDIHSRGLTVLEALVLLGIFLVLIGILLPSLSRSRPSKSTQCLSNLKTLATSVLNYASQNRGEFPDSVETLVSSGSVFKDPSLIGRVLVCPATSDTPAAGATMPQFLQDLNSKPRAESYAPGEPRSAGHCSYIYVGRGLKRRGSIDTRSVLFYEPLSNEHYQGKSINVAFADGHVQSVKTSDAQRMIVELQSGHNPPESQ